MKDGAGSAEPRTNCDMREMGMLEPWSRQGEWISRDIREVEFTGLGGQLDVVDEEGVNKYSFLDWVTVCGGWTGGTGATER